MQRGLLVVSAGLIACASIATGAQFTPNRHTSADTSFMVLSGGGACPSGTTLLYTGSSIVLRNPGNGNLTEDARCWQVPPTPTAHVDVEVLAPCAVCRFGR